MSEETEKTTSEIIEEALTTPQSATVDGQTVNQRSADDVIKLASYRAAAAMNRQGRLFGVMKPKGNSAL